MVLSRFQIVGILLITIRFQPLAKNSIPKYSHPPGFTYHLTVGAFFEPEEKLAPMTAGGEASLIMQWCSGKYDAAHNLFGFGIASGVGSSKAYVEPEFILQYTPNDPAARKLGHSYPLFFITAGIGLFHRISDSYPLRRGYQWTISGLFTFIPIMMYVRTQDSKNQESFTNVGFMIKVPIELGNVYGNRN